jgi:hypothetical protein
MVTICCAWSSIRNVYILATETIYVGFYVAVWVDIEYFPKLYWLIKGRW